MRIRFEGVTQRYEAAPLFDGLDLEIPSGRFFTLLGPSGCGKTTLLRMLAGFVVPESGRVWFGDVDVTAMPVHKRGVGMVFQDSCWNASGSRLSPNAPRPRSPVASASAWRWRARW